MYYTMYSVNRKLFTHTFMDLLGEKSAEEELQREREEAYRKKVLDTFFEYGKLKAIPTQKKKERIILEKIAEAFDTNRDYSEREVNIIFADFFDDFCTIRRDMISESLLTRDHGIYRKSEPGTVLISDDEHMHY